MILKSLLINNFGPFALPTRISIDEKTTVFTGQNDVGKSSVLRLLRIIGENLPMQEDDVNTDHIYESKVPWEEDEEIYCIATYSVIENSKKFFRTTVSNFGKGWEVDIRFFLAPKKKRMEVVGLRTPTGSSVTNKDMTLRSVPKVLFLPSLKDVNSVVDTTFQPENSLDNEFLLLAFGENYSSKLQSLGEINLTRETRAAATRITKTAKKLFPPSMKMEFLFDKMLNSGNASNQKLIISLRDKDDCDTAIHLRGSGIKKIISLMPTILNKVQQNNQLLILFDEPENSLHANAQHMLRAFLEDLATSQNIQVIYVTHSPSMINTMQTEGIRLFKRENSGGKATTVVDNHPIEDNFYPIRSSLGISPSDSLLYAPITIVVEGETEVLGLPVLLKRLYEEKVDGFGLVNKLLSFSHILDGHGSSFEYWCRIAKSQGCKPIIFVDGDKYRELQQQKVSEKHPDVPIVILDGRSEFEDLIPKDIYFQALCTVLGNDEITQLAFSSWEERRNIERRIAFTKRIDWWLSEAFPNISYNKPTVMKKAIELVDLGNMRLEKIKELVDNMATILNNNQFE